MRGNLRLSFYRLHESKAMALNTAHESDFALLLHKFRAYTFGLKSHYLVTHLHEFAQKFDFLCSVV